MTTWLWALSPHRGPVLDVPDHEAIRLCLGIAGPTEPTPCRLCGKDAFDSNAAHALCCDKSNTRGHHNVTRAIFDVAATCDPSTELEANNLIPGKKLRPADILTGAVGSGRHALDVGICSPDARGAGEDCIATMYKAKVDYYEPYIEDLSRQSIRD